MKRSVKPNGLQQHPNTYRNLIYGKGVYQWGKYIWVIPKYLPDESCVKNETIKVPRRKYGKTISVINF